MDEETQSNLAEESIQRKRTTFFQVLILILSIVLSYFIWTSKAVQNPVFGIVGAGLLIFYGIQITAAIVSASVYNFGLKKYKKPKFALLLAATINILAGFYLRWLVP